MLVLSLWFSALLAGLDGLILSFGMRIRWRQRAKT